MKATGTDALSRFRELEGRIASVLDALATARSAKTTAEKGLADSRDEVRRLQTELEGMRDERLKIRSRVERLVSSIAELDQKKEKKIV
jgi:chromosome segregation ATPase